MRKKGVGHLGNMRPGDVVTLHKHSTDSTAEEEEEELEEEGGRRRRRTGAIHTIPSNR